jgi:hypothetical protein
MEGTPTAFGLPGGPNKGALSVIGAVHSNDDSFKRQPPALVLLGFGMPLVPVHGTRLLTLLQ